MTGAEHYAEAERLLKAAEQAPDLARSHGFSGNSLAVSLDVIIAQAQVHATLALAAATVAGEDWFDTTSGATS